MVVQNQDPPFAIFFDVLVLVDSAFPPLAGDMVTRGWGVLVQCRFVQTSLHERSCPDLGMEAVRIDIDDFLELGMVQEKPVVGTIATTYETGLEIVNVKPLHAFRAPVYSPVEHDRRLFFRREQSVHLLVQTYCQ